MKILFIGDIVGKPGRDIIKTKLQHFIDKYDVDFVIANGENVTHGKGLIYRHYQELMEYGIDVFTLGNHYDSKHELARFIDDVDNIIRPANLTSGSYPGIGTNVFFVNGYSIRVTNILGEAFMTKPNITNHYLCLKEIVEEEEKADIHIVDFHGESTSEKQIIGYLFDGQVSAVLGTHTHVQTRDAKILQNGTAFMCDVGMCGANESIIGWDKDTVINKMIFGSSKKFEVAEGKEKVFNALLLNIDERDGKCKEVVAINYVYEE